MLERLIRLNNVAVFRQGLPKALDLAEATLLYAENARGKSTLAAVLRSLASAEPGPVMARATFGGGPPIVELRFSAAGKTANAKFENGKWDTALPQLLVFDQAFVETNVYAASEVGPENHQALLEFALGAAAVQKKQDVERAGAEQTNATKRRTAAEDQLKGYMGKLTLAAFLALADEPAADQKMRALQRRIVDAKDAASLAARPSLKEIADITYDFTKVVEVLETSLDGIHAEAAARVKKHIAHLGHPGVEQWLASGLQFQQDDDKCPFCAQDTAATTLLGDYKAYFNAAYRAHQLAVASLRALVGNCINRQGLGSLANTHAANEERVNTWAPQVKLSLTPPDHSTAEMLAAEAEGLLRKLVEKKEAAPFDAIDASEVLQEAAARLEEARTVLAGYNVEVRSANAVIAQFKEGLLNDKPAQLEAELERVRLQKVRHSQEVKDLIQKRSEAESDRGKWENAKAAARESLDKLMAQVLGDFQNSINNWLSKFGAPFSIQKLKPTYQGGGGLPRTEYGILVRGTTVPAGKKAAGPCFQTALSEGDKRTLALAFFLARLFGDPLRAEKVVVLDDLFTSLDKHRRSMTVDAIAAMAGVVEQVLVLGHDAHFLRDVSMRLTKKAICKQVVLQAVREADGYSALEGCNLDDVCASEYFRRYKSLQDFLGGTPSESPLAVAQGMRTLFEGHLHRRFPGHVKEGVTVGVVLDQIKNAPAGTPLAVLQPCLAALHELNDFTGMFHHDTSGVAPRADVTDHELRTYGMRTMQLLHAGHL